MSKFKVGDLVRIVGNSDGQDCVGKEGYLVEDDATEIPFRIDFGAGDNEYWFAIGDVANAGPPAKAIPERERKAAAKAVREAQDALLEAMNEAQLVGILVNASDCYAIAMTYQPATPPAKTY